MGSVRVLKSMPVVMGWRCAIIFEHQRVNVQPSREPLLRLLALTLISPAKPWISNQAGCATTLRHEPGCIFPYTQQHL